MTAVERMRGEDAAFLYLEGPTTPYHMAALGIVEGPAPDHEELVAAIGERIAFSPRLLQRLENLPLARPRWVDDPHFDLGYHVRRTTVPAPGGERQLLELAGRLHAQHLSRARPLWECWVIDGLAGDRFALLIKVHHSLFDGVSGAGLMEILFDPSPEPRSYDPEPWIPRRTPRRGALALSAAVSAAFTPFALTRDLVRLARSPRRILGRGAEIAGGIASLISAVLDPAPSSPLNVAIGPNRAIAVGRAPLADLRDAKASLGGTVNDVVITAVSGGLRLLLGARGRELRDETLRALVPVSLRGAGGPASGNRVTGILAPLPVSEADAGRRLAIVRRATRIAKASRQGAGSELLLEIGAALPPPVARLVAAAQSVQRFFNISVTNVPGPASPLWVRGRRVVEIIPLPPLSANAALIVAAMSYAGQMTFGVVADGDAFPDAGLVAEGIEKAIVELLHEAETVA